MNWTGKVFMAPRPFLPALLKRAEAQRTGVYFLVGPSPDKTGLDQVYIGEADDVAARLRSHARDEKKDFFERVCVVVSKDENLTKAHGRFLEARLIAQAAASSLVELANSDRPEPPPLPEADVADMEYFLEQIGLMLPVIGFGFLDPDSPSAARQAPMTEDAPSFAVEAADTPVFTLVGRAGKPSARAVERDGRFLVLAGSTARLEPTETYKASGSTARRDQLIADGKLRPVANDPSLLGFAETVAFSSPSAASSNVMARHDNGRRTWKVEGTGQTYADWQDAQVGADVEERQS